MLRNIATKTDLTYGLTNEITIKSILEKFFKCKFEKTLNKYDKMDFINKLLKIFIELKSRRFAYEKYNTTFINFQKIEYANKLLKADKDNKVYFVFKYTNGLYFIKYDEYLFSTFKKQNTYLPKRDCMIFNYLIPTDRLKRVD